jgi:hypothetical protein
MATAKKTKPLTKSAVVEAVTKAHGHEIPRKHVKQVVEALVAETLRAERFISVSPVNRPITVDSKWTIDMTSAAPEGCKRTW